MKLGPFHIDEANADDRYLYVDVEGYGTVAIKREDAGIVVDIFPLHVADEPVASTWAALTELMGEESPDTSI